jgi:hypothetical protein
MKPRKPRRIAPPNGLELSITGKVGPFIYDMEMPPAKSRIVRGPDGKLIAIPIPPPDAAPPAPPAGDAAT